MIDTASIMNILADTQLLSLFTSAAFIIVGLYGAIFLDNIIKKIIGIAFIEEGANLFILTLGYKQGGVIPIFLPGMNAEWFAANSAYPLPQALVLTTIVIGASVLAVMLAIAMVLYKKHGTLSASEIFGDKKIISRNKNSTSKNRGSNNFDDVGDANE
ncbi:MAG: cation:proton antiporter subunit C [Methanobrevibacter sp.]|nr:cation:proton antiporter subunit C [Methanobrevibacter sp.]